MTIEDLKSLVLVESDDVFLPLIWEEDEEDEYVEWNSCDVHGMRASTAEEYEGMERQYRCYEIQSNVLEIGSQVPPFNCLNSEAKTINLAPFPQSEDVIAMLKQNVRFDIRIFAH